MVLTNRLRAQNGRKCFILRNTPGLKLSFSQTRETKRLGGNAVRSWQRENGGKRGLEAQNLQGFPT